MRPTMMDVAAKAGVSQATVSLVLNSRAGARLSEATREKVRAAAEELGYQLAARGQAKAPVASRTIGFLVDELTTDPWMSMAFDSAREKALEQGVTTTLAVLRGKEDLENQVLAQMSNKPLLGLIYGTILTRPINPPKAFFETPTVLVNCYDKKRKLPSVLPGELVGAQTATQHLIDTGCRRIAFINGQDGIDASRDRLRGYRQALSSNDLPFDPQYVFPGNWEPSTGYEGARTLMALDTPPDGMFCANDMMALGCYDALRELGLRVPEDVAVVGFDNREIAQFMRPPLTTLVLPHAEMGAIAAEMLLDMAGGMHNSHDQIKVECALIDRDSTRSKAGRA